MATLNAVIVPAKVLKGGKHKIRISVAHNSETRYILTNIIIDSAKEFRNGAVTKRPDAAMLNTKLRRLLQQYQERIDALSYVEGLSCAELVYQLTHNTKEIPTTLQELFDEYITKPVKESTALLNRSMWRTLSKFLDSTQQTQNLTPRTISKLENDLGKFGYSKTYKAMLIILLKTVINYAKRCGYIKYNIDPFVNYKQQKLMPRNVWLSTEEIKALRDCKNLTKCQCRCRDLFMLSYYLGGINIIDLINIDFNQFNKTIKYKRTKTKDIAKINEYVIFDIPEEAQQIIKRLTDSSGRIKATESQRKCKFSPFLNKYLPQIGKIVGIEKLIYYSARKSFSQHAFNLGISTAVIDYILGHSLSSNNTIYSYIYVTPQMATEAIRKVLDNLK